MAVVGLDWNINNVTLNAANNYQAVAPLTVYFDSNYAGQFTVVVSSGSLTPITLTLTGNGTDTYVADFLVRAEDWFTSANNTDTNISLELSSEGLVGGSGLGVYLEDVDPECTSLTFVSDWSDPTVFIQQVTRVTATATFDLKFGATIEEAHIYSLFSSGSSIYLSLSQSGDVWTGTRNAPTFMAWGVGDIRLEATDSRGKVCTFYHFSGNPITVYKHGVVTLNIDAYRCDSNGDRDLGGGYIAVTAYATPNPAEVMPAISLVRVGILDGNGGTVVSRRWVNNGEKVILGGGTLDPTIAYSVVADANDGYSGSQKTKTFAIPPVNRIINVKDGGTGVAFGKLATEDALLDSAWDINTDGEYLVQGQPLVDTLPDASTTTRGLVSTGVQTFGGDKTFNGIAKFRSSEGTPEIHFVSKSNDPADYNGIMYLATPLTGSNRRTDRFIFRGMSYNSSTGARLTNYENYQLPSVNADRTSNATYNILTSKSPVTIAQGGTGQTGQTAQQSYTPTVSIGTTAQTVSSLSAYYKSWGLMKLIGGRFNLTTTGTGQLIISLPAGFTVPTSAVQPMGILIAPDQKAYHIRVSADGLAAMSNGGGNVTWATGYYCFWAVVMGN